MPQLASAPRRANQFAIERLYPYGMVRPGISAGVNRPASLLADLPHHAVRRILAEFELPAGKLPLRPLVLQQQHPPRPNRDALTDTGNACVAASPLPAFRRPRVQHAPHPRRQVSRPGYPDVSLSRCRAPAVGPDAVRQWQDDTNGTISKLVFLNDHGRSGFRGTSGAL
jgi:hypothetical protein